MNKTQALVKQSELPNRLILDYKTTKNLGKVNEVWLDPHAHAIRGLTSHAGFWKTKTRTFPWECIKAIGKDSIIVDAEGSDTSFKETKNVQSVIGHELWTDAGSKVGHIIDYLIDPETGQVVRYLFRSDGWSGLMKGVYALRPSAISSIGSQRLIAVDEAVRESDKYAEGLEEKLHHAQAFLEQDLEKSKEDWEAAQQKGRAIAEEVQKTAQSVSEQIKEKFVQDKVSEEGSQLSENDSESDTADQREKIDA